MELVDGELQRRFALKVLVAAGLVVATLVVADAIRLWRLRSASETLVVTYTHRVDLATAPVEELVLLPGIGPATAAAWVSRRDQLLQVEPDPVAAFDLVPRVGPSVIAKIQPHLADGPLRR